MIYILKKCITGPWELAWWWELVLTVPAEVSDSQQSWQLLGSPAQGTNPFQASAGTCAHVHTPNIEIIKNKSWKKRVLKQLLYIITLPYIKGKSNLHIDEINVPVCFYTRIKCYVSIWHCKTQCQTLFQNWYVIGTPLCINMSFRRREVCWRLS